MKKRALQIALTGTALSVMAGVFLAARPDERSAESIRKNCPLWEKDIPGTLGMDSEWALEIKPFPDTESGSSAELYTVQTVEGKIPQGQFLRGQFSDVRYFPVTTWHNPHPNPIDIKGRGAVFNYLKYCVSPTSENSLDTPGLAP